MMPSPALFAAAMDAMNITNESTIVVYGQEQCPTVHRAWYTFYAMGHELSRIKMLDGSLADWRKQGGPLDDDDADATPRVVNVDDLTAQLPSLKPRYKAHAHGPRQVVNKQDVLQVCRQDTTPSTRTKKTLIVDARSAERFRAQAPEPRPGLRLGHMPGAKNLPFITLLDADNLNRLAPTDTLRQKFMDAGIDPADDSLRIITTCGSGATACTLAAAWMECGGDPSHVDIYDGSWMEWGADPNTPIVVEEE
jgi:thiosulfate/3-mercaptopyruvate sulfurtransferase